MFLSIIILPLLGSIVAGFFGRKVGVSGAQFVTCLCVITTTILAVLAFFEVGFNNSPVSIELFRWIDSEWFNITWGFEFDSLTVSMLLPVLIISSLVHIYSISYMSNDPHIQRFFSYLSLFTFMMIILVTGNNYLLMFVGWEGNPTIRPKWLSQLDDSNLKARFFMHNCGGSALQKRFFFSKNFKSIERIGPHNLDVISLIVGSLLSNSYLEKRKSGLGIRIVFIKCSNNVEYLMWFHSVLSDNGYCSNKKPKLYKIIGKGNKVLFTYSIKSYSFSSFTWLFNMFYRHNIKIIPRNLDKYLTPLALATLFLSSPGLGQNSKLATICISAEDLEYLSLILKNKYNIETIIKFNNKSLNSGKDSSGSLYIKNTSFSTFSKVVKPHLLHSQHYLLNMPVLKLNISRGQCIQNHSYLSSSIPGDKRGFSTLRPSTGASPGRKAKKDLSDRKYTIKYKKEYILSLEQKEALIGIILGDGFLDRVKPNHNTRLRLEQSYPEKEKYLISLYRLFEPISTMSPTILTFRPGLVQD